MITHREFSAWITSEGAPIREYETVVDDKKNQVSCWIPSREGKTFTLHWRDHGGYVDTATYIYLDGFVVPGRFLFGYGEASKGAVRVGANSERPFAFAKIEDEETTRKVGNGKDLGTIMLKIKRVKRTGVHEPNAPQSPPQPARGRRSTGEPCIGYGQERPASKQTIKTWRFQPYDNDKSGTYVTFVFRYRSMDFLLGQGIISSPDTEDVMDEDKPMQTSTPPLTPALRRQADAFPTPMPSPSPPRSGELSQDTSFDDLLWTTNQTSSSMSFTSAEEEDPVERK